MASSTPAAQRYDLICLGCGPAGEKAATQAAYFGKRVAIIERAARPGGAMVNTGTLPSKALRETALLCSAFNRRPLPGMEFRIDRSVSIAKFMARRHLLELQEHDRIESSIDRHGIEVHRGFGRFIDEHSIEIAHQDREPYAIEGEFVLIATGSSPLRPKQVPFDDRCVVDADSVLTLERMPKSMIIVGGGVIGCEYASIFAEMDVEVTLIHPRRDVLPFVDSECRTHLMDAMRETGVRFELNRTAETISRQRKGGVEVMLDNGRTLRADVLLWTAGRSSNTDGLGIEAIGVEADGRGQIIVDAHYRTKCESVFAAGDVIGFPALAATSMEQGRIAACHMFGQSFKTEVAANMPIGIYTIPPVSSVGINAAEAQEKGIDAVCGRGHYKHNARGRMLGDEQGLLKCVFERTTRKLLGATIVGESATELVHIAQAVMDAGDGIDYFIDTCFNYPSLSELYKYAAYGALQAMSEAESATSERSAA